MRQVALIRQRERPQSVIFEGAEAAVARINLDSAPESGLLSRIQSGNADIIEVNLLSLTS